MTILRTTFQGLLLASAVASPAFADDPFDLKVLYAGHPGSQREAQFRDLLKTYFRQVDTTDYREFKESQADGHDVVIFDWDEIYPRGKDGKILQEFERMAIPKAPVLSERYARPTILIGAPGQVVVKKRQLKIDWGCLCLDDFAHGMAVSHDIFRTPLNIELKLEEMATPEHYLSLAGSTPLPKKMNAWRMQTRKFPEIDLGLVVRGFGFDDSPDAEAISSGLNQKGSEMVAIGRQGNFLLWGFAASPGDMTPEARKCFINALCYIRKFDGQRPIVRKSDRTLYREMADVGVHFLTVLLDEDAFKRTLPEGMRTSAELVKKQRDLELYVFKEMYPEEVRSRLGMDPAKYAEWLRQNNEWLMPVGENPDFVQTGVDEDVKSLGLSNHKVELLDRCVTMLERNDRPEVARRVLERYTTEKLSAATDWRSWLESNRERLFFTEAGGYKFLVAPRSVIPVIRHQRIPLDARMPPTARQPVTIQLAVEPDRAPRGASLRLIARVDIFPGWHIAGKGSRGREIPTTLVMSLPRGLKALGEWEFPEGSPDAEGKVNYSGTIEIRRRIRIALEAPSGLMTLSGSLSYQACDRFSCRAPDEIEFEAKLEITNELPRVIPPRTAIEIDRGTDEFDFAQDSEEDSSLLRLLLKNGTLAFSSTE